MNGVDFPVAQVLDGIAAAREAGLAPIKINTVVRRGLNEDAILPLARWARDEGLILRFIEYMDVGHTNGWRLDDVVTAEEIVGRDRCRDAARAAGRRTTAARSPALALRATDRARSGVIASVSRPFCGDCTRARLSADGKLYTCLFAVVGHDLRALLRAGATRCGPRGARRAIWRVRDDRYSELRPRRRRSCRGPRCTRWAADGGVHTSSTAGETVDVAATPCPRLVDNPVDPTSVAYRRSCPKGPTEAGPPRLTSRLRPDRLRHLKGSSGPERRRSHQALGRSPVASGASFPAARLATALRGCDRRDVIGIPVSILSPAA